MAEAVGSSSPGELFSGRVPPRIVTISGANKDIGKSSLAAHLVSHCRSCAGMKVSIHAERPPGNAVLEEESPSQSPGTDTARMVEAGARPVFWVRTTVEHLADDFKEAISRIETPVVIVEGNSILRLLDPDYAVFIMGASFDDFKPSAFEAIKKAHTVVVNGTQALSGAQILELEKGVRELNPHAKLVVVSELGRERAWEIVLSRAAARVGGEYMSDEVDERIKKAVQARAKDGRIPCAVALKLAEELKVPALEVGKAANALGIKIAQCSLGCF